MVIAGYAIAVRDDPLLRSPARTVPLTLLLAGYIVLLWLSPRLMVRRRRMPVFFAVQATLAFAVGLLTPGHWLAIMLYMSMTGIGVSLLWPDLRKVGVIALLGLILSTYHMVASWGWGSFAQTLPTLGIILAFVVIAVVLYTRQVRAREQAQDLLQELETAHRQLQAYADRVEELTITQERQRMAQELHDTLAQGLAGLILQLEAADSHLEGGNAPKAQETVQRAMERARTTLREARRAIQALRPAVLEQDSLVDALGREMDEFAAATGKRATFQVDSSSPDVPPAAAQDILRIVQESLTNAARHAEAEHVVVRLETDNDWLRVVVEDDGRGFDPDEVAGQPGSFGLRGLKERADHIGGELQVRSAPGRGTTVTLEMEMPYDPRADRR
jgi:NarL family two-component system sensor histidine kinase YdfH